MGRLLQALRAETRPVATPATLATFEAEIPAIVAESQESQRPAEFATRMLAVLRAKGLPDDWLGLDHGEPETVAALTDRQLFAYVRMLADIDLRRRGKVPPDETAAALCHHCGPVWVHPAVVAVAPVVEGWPRLLGCPWCHVRAVGGPVPCPSHRVDPNARTG